MPDDAKDFIRAQRWPGNVRQVYNALLQAAVFNTEAEISSDDLAASLTELPGSKGISILDHTVEEGFQLDDVLDDLRRHYTQIAYEKCGRNANEAGKLLGVSGQTVRNYIKSLGIQ